MIELPNNKISRNLPEQVGFNSAKIAEIIKFLNESGLKDLVINLEDMPGVLSADQYLIAEQSPSYIVYDGAVFYKLAEDSDYIDYVLLMDSVSVDSSIVVSTYRIRITRNSLNYAMDSVNLFETYNKSQIDSALSALDTAKANLSGANFTGAITAPSIIENMPGYSAAGGASEINKIFVGAVKNGNKLTIVYFATLNCSAKPDTGFWSLGTLTIPSNVGEKLYPFTLSGFNNLLAKKVIALDTGVGINSSVSASSVIQKLSNTSLVFYLYDNSNIQINTEYLFRIEATFLLNNSLSF